jgi:RNA polymerase sigma factor (sigma-70 family)
MLVKMTVNDLDLLEQFAREGSQDAFATLVNRHLNLVYSAALRQVPSRQLAEEVVQSAFTDLARSASNLAPNTILTAWLYQVTRRTAIDVVRREVRRQKREQTALELNTMNAPEAQWTHIAPLLDDAMNELDDADRTAVLLRYFENKSLREVGESLGTSEDAAQKRVSRAVERMREFFSRQGVPVGANGLIAVLSANAVQTAPVGFAATISAVGIVAGVALPTASIAIAAKTIIMTTLQKTIIGTVLAAAIGTGIYEARQASVLQARVETLQREQAPLTNQIAELEASLESVKAQFVKAGEVNSRLAGQVQTFLKKDIARNVGVEKRSMANVTAAADLSRGTNAVSEAMGNMMQVAAEQQMELKLATMKTRLNLTPDQETAIRDILTRQTSKMSETMQGMFSGKGINTNDLAKAAMETAGQGPTLESLLTPEQSTAYAAMQKEEQSKGVRMMANMELTQMQSFLQLDEAQQDKVFAALVESAQNPEFDKSIGTDPAALCRAQIQHKVEAMRSVLTPEQMKSYQKYQDQQLSIVENMFKKITK